MMFNRDYLFLHVPRTGGKSTKWLLSQCLTPPIFIFQAYNRDQYASQISKKDIIFNLKNEKLKQLFISLTQYEKPYTIKHLSDHMAEECWDTDVLSKVNPFVHAGAHVAKRVVEACGIDFNNQIKIINLRNHYHRARAIYELELKDACLDTNKLAKRKNFESFIYARLSKLSSSYWYSNLRYFTTINDKIINDLKILRLTNLADDLRAIFNKIDINFNDIKAKQNSAKRMRAVWPERFIIRDKVKTIDTLNTWEEWSIQNNLLSALVDLN